MVVRQAFDPENSTSAPRQSDGAIRRPTRWAIDLSVRCERPIDFALKLRLPWWIAGPARIMVNGEPQAISTEPSSFVAIRRTWSDDRVRIELPKALTTCPLPDRPDTVAFMDGPVVLAGLCDEERTLHGDKDHPETLLIPDHEREWSTWKGWYRTAGQERGIRFVPLYEVRDERYTVYFPVNPDEALGLRNRIETLDISRGTRYMGCRAGRGARDLSTKRSRPGNMATLSVWKFDTAEGAQQILEKVQSLQKQQLIVVQDAAIVTWPKGKDKPKTQQLHNMAGVGAMQGAFWGMLFGLIFFVPFFGLAIGVAMGALSGKFADYGIDDNFIKEVRTKVTEGTSALFLLTSDAVQDKVLEALKGTKMELIQSNLTAEQEAQLKATFGNE